MILLIALFLANSAAPVDFQGQPADTIVVTSDHFRIYGRDGTPATFDDIRAAMMGVDVVFVGEHHDDPVSHFIERRVLEAWHDIYGSAAAVSFEMFARDVQYIVDEYLNDLITESHFQRSSNPWNNYETDYKPLLEYAKEHRLDVIAANAPKRYSNRVTRLGRQSLHDLSDRAQTFLAPLPYAEASERYRSQFSEVMTAAVEAMAAASKKPTDEIDRESQKADTSEAKPIPGSSTHSAETMLDAQSLWDATMAWSIAEYLMRHPGSKVAHMVGGFHVASGTGIPEHLVQYRPEVRMLIISMQGAEDVDIFDPEEHTGAGDFVILGDSSLPRTFTARAR